MGDLEKLIVIGDSNARAFKYITKNRLIIDGANLGSVQKENSNTRSRAQIENFINKLCNKDNKEIIILFGINDIWAIFLKCFLVLDINDETINKRLGIAIDEQVSKINNSLKWLIKKLRDKYTSSNINFLGIVPIDTLRKKHIKNLAMYYYWISNLEESKKNKISKLSFLGSSKKKDTLRKLYLLYSEWKKINKSDPTNTFIDKFNKIFNIWFPKIDTIRNNINSVIKRNITGKHNLYFIDIENLIKTTFNGILKNPYVYTKAFKLNYGYIDTHIRRDVLMYALLKEDRILNVYRGNLERLKRCSRGYLNWNRLKDEMNNFEKNNFDDKTYGSTHSEKKEKINKFLNIFKKGLENVVSFKLYTMNNLKPYRKKIYSQNDEDGITLQIIKIINDAKIQLPKYYFEFGVEDGKECNTRILRNKWKGVILDGGHYNPKIHLYKEIIKYTNIWDLIKKYKIPKTIGLLSIDTDYNDAYLFCRLIKKTKPLIVIAEYNINLGLKDCTVIHDPDYFWDYSTYYGCSALCLKRVYKDYKIVYANSINLFFVHNSIISKLDFKKQSLNTLLKPYLKSSHQQHLKQDYFNRSWATSKEVNGNFVKKTINLSQKINKILKTINLNKLKRFRKARIHKGFEAEVERIKLYINTTLKNTKDKKIINTLISNRLSLLTKNK